MNKQPQIHIYRIAANLKEYFVNVRPNLAVKIPSNFYTFESSLKQRCSSSVLTDEDVDNTVYNEIKQFNANEWMLSLQP